MVLIVPGLTGSSEANYVRELARLLRSSGFCAICYNPRGLAGNSMEAPLVNALGYTEDLRRVVNHIVAAHPDTPLMAVGFSMGANYLGKYVGEEGPNCPLSAAACLGSPVNGLLIPLALRGTVAGRIVDRVLVSNVQRERVNLEHALSRHPGIDIQKVRSSKTMPEFDHFAIAPMYDFASGNDYYREASSGKVLSRIRRPTLFLNAANDPVCPGDRIRLSEQQNFESNGYLCHVLTAEGGHSMQWHSGVLRTKPWALELVVDFLAAVSDESPLLLKV